MKTLLSPLLVSVARYFSLALLLLLFACSSTPPKDEEPETIEEQPVTEPELEGNKSSSPAKVLAPPRSSSNLEMKPVVRQLLETSRKKMAIFDYNGAANLIERGINISPSNPHLWTQLAEIRLKQNDFLQAEQLANKAKMLAHTDPALQAQNNRIIAESRRLRKR